MEAEVVHLEPEAAIGGILVKQLADFIDVARLAVRGHAHHFVFAVVDTEAEIGGERRIEQADRMGEALFFKQCDRVATAGRVAVPCAGRGAERRRCPFADAVNRQHGGLAERAGEKRAGGVAHVVIAEQDLIRIDMQVILNDALDPELFLQPVDHRIAPYVGGRGKCIQRGEQNALKFDQRLFVEDDMLQIVGGDPCLAQAEIDGLLRKAVVVFLAREAFFHRSGDQFAVVEERGGGVVIEAGNTEDVHQLALLSGGIEIITNGFARCPGRVHRGLTPLERIGKQARDNAEGNENCVVEQYGNEAPLHIGQDACNERESVPGDTNGRIQVVTPYGCWGDSKRRRDLLQAWGRRALQWKPDQDSIKGLRRMRVGRIVLILLAVYYVFFGGNNYYLQSLPIRFFHHDFITIIASLWLAARLIRRRGVPQTPINDWLIAGVGVWIVSTVFALDPRMAIESLWIPWVNLILFWFVAAQIEDRREALVFEIQFLVGALVAGFALAHLASWYFGLGLTPDVRLGWAGVGLLIPLETPQIYMPFGVSTWLAAYTAPLAIVCAGWGITHKRRDARAALLILAGALLFVTLMTFSRGGFVSLAGSVVVIGLNAASRLRIQDQRVRWAIGAVSGVGLVIGVALVIALLSRSAARAAGDVLRADLWNSAGEMLRDDPLTGVGIGQFGRAHRLYRNPGLADDRLSTAHNTALNIAAETGLAGALVAVGTAGAIAWVGWRHYMAADSGRKRRLVFAVAALIGFAAQSVFDTFTLPALVSLPIVLIAFVVTTPRDATETARQGDRRLAVLALLITLAAGAAWFVIDLAQYQARPGDNNDELRIAGRLDPAMRLYRLQVLEREAQLAIIGADYEGAIAFYQEAVALEPTWAVGWLNLAALAEMSNSPTSAIAYLERADAIDRYNGAAVHWARLAEVTGAGDEAIIRARYLQGMEGEVRLPLAEFWRATPFRLETALAFAESQGAEVHYRVTASLMPEGLASIVPDNPVTAVEWWAYGEHLLNIDGNRAGAEQAFTRAIELRGHGDDYASRARARIADNVDGARRDLDIADLLGTRYETPNATRALLASSPDERRALLLAAVAPRVIDQNFEGVLFGGRVAGFEVLLPMREIGLGRAAYAPWYTVAEESAARGDPLFAARVYRAILDAAPDEREAQQLLNALTEKAP